MIGMMVLIVQHQVFVQCRLDLLKHGPAQPGTLLQSNNMLLPVLCTKILKHGM